MRYNPEKKEIVIEKKLNELDKFVYDFVKKLDKYVIVSGYVSIILGRARATEDVDLIVPTLNFEEFEKLHAELEKEGFWCLNGDNTKTLYDEYLLVKSAIRYAKKDTAIPNMEFKMAQSKIDEEALNNTVKVFIDKAVFNISNLELQIAYKKKILGSPKDLEDARHIEKLFNDELDFDKIKNYEAMLA